MSDRAQILREIFGVSGFGLEIGPSHAPIFPKKMGFNVEILDYASADKLRKNYIELGVDISQIEEVDYISDGRSIDEIIPRRAEYDFIFSSHVIEHMPDIVSFIRASEMLLKPGGVLAMAIPDKRYVFDVLRRTSSTGEVLEAYLQRRKRHSSAAMFDFFADYAKFGDQDSWGNQLKGMIENKADLPKAYRLIQNSDAGQGEYHDVHGWVFSPSSFRLIMHDLAALGLTNFKERFLREAHALEFYVALSVDSAGNGLDRSTLHRALLWEEVISGLQLLASNNPVVEAARMTIGA